MCLRYAHICTQPKPHTHTAPLQGLNYCHIWAQGSYLILLTYYHFPLHIQENLIKGMTPLLKTERRSSDRRSSYIHSNVTVCIFKNTKHTQQHYLYNFTSLTSLYKPNIVFLLKLPFTLSLTNRDLLTLAYLAQASGWDLSSCLDTGLDNLSQVTCLTVGYFCTFWWLTSP